MKIIDCIQGTPEWFQERSLRMTGSHAQAIAANGKGLDTYINQLMQEHYSSSERESYKSTSMIRGNELEDSAAFTYECETGILTNKVGFVVRDDYVGVSPDRMCNDRLVEIKCLEDKAYFNYLCSEKIDTGYEWQMQMQMLICEIDTCDYVVYNPNFKKNLIIKSVRSDRLKFEKIEHGILSGIEKIKKIKEKFDNIL